MVGPNYTINYNKAERQLPRLIYLISRPVLGNEIIQSAATQLRTEIGDQQHQPGLMGDCCNGEIVQETFGAVFQQLNNILSNVTQYLHSSWSNSQENYQINTAREGGTDFKSRKVQ